MERMHIENLEDFSEELVKYLTDTDIFTRTKTDICEFLIYLTNKYSNNYLFKNSNYDNSCLLHIKQSKVRLVKEDISVRYMDDDARNDIFMTFLKNIRAESTSSDNEKKSLYYLLDDEEKFVIYIEDPCVRNEFERYLKKYLGVSCDYSFNREKISVRKSDFLLLLSKYSNLSDSKNLHLVVEDLYKQDEKNILANYGNDIIESLLGDWASISVKAVCALCNNFISKIKIRK